MTIERISFPEGLPLIRGADPKNAIAQAIARDQAEIRSLPTGEYDLTPAAYTENTHRHTLLVQPDGTGIYRMLPLGLNVGHVDLITGREFPGEKIIHIPRDEASVIMAGFKETTPALFEVILYMPGRSPIR